jgi:hypothetical protein
MSVYFRYLEFTFSHSGIAYHALIDTMIIVIKYVLFFMAHQQLNKKP